MHNVSPIRILIAEDEETDAFFARQAFEQTEFKNIVEIVKDGQELIDYLEKKPPFESAQRPHMILLDINMPRKNGHEALQYIKSMPHLKNIPVIMLSGSKTPADVSRSYEGQASAYVPKSQGFTEMLSFVSALEEFWFSKACLPQRDG